MSDGVVYPLGYQSAKQTGLTLTGPLVGSTVAPSGLTGATAAGRFAGFTATGAPGSGTFAQGDVVTTQDGHVFICTVAGSPGTWQDVASADLPSTILLHTANAAAIGPVTNTETILASLTTLVAGSTLKVGSKISMVVDGTCTSSVANAVTFNIRAGTAGTTADASVATAAVTAATSGTSVAFRAAIELVVRTLGSAGTAAGTLLVSNQGTTGIENAAVSVVPFTSATFATTTATAIDLTLVTAASTTAVTVQDVTLTVTP